MPRSRMVKPEFWTDEKLHRISRDARLTFIGLLTYSDDYGVVKGYAGGLRSQLYPGDDLTVAQVETWLQELIDLQRIIPFSHNEEQYYHIVNFTKHQKINRPSKQRNPAPPPHVIERLSEYSVSAHGALIDETETETESETETETEKDVGRGPAPSAAADTWRPVLEILRSIDARNYRTLKFDHNWIDGLERAAQQLGSVEAVTTEARGFATYLLSRFDAGKERRDKRHMPRSRFINTWLANAVKFRERDAPETALSDEQQLQQIIERNRRAGLL